MKATLFVVAALALAASGCNDSKLAGATQATPGPTGTPTPLPGDGPIAIITGGQPQYSPLDGASFDGSSSYDPDGNAITAWTWAVDTRPSGSQAHLFQNGLTTAQQSMTIDLAGDYTIRLTVTNSLGQTGTTTFSFSAVPSQDLHVELLWPGQYGQVDMDLHLVAKSAGGLLWDAAKDCYFGNCTPGGAGLEWGDPGQPLDNPSLDIDNIASYVPENINVKKPADGTYSVCIHYYSSMFNDIPVDNEVRVFLQQQPAFDGHQTMTAENQVWYVGDIDCASGTCTFTHVGTMATTGSGNPSTAVCGP